MQLRTSAEHFHLLWKQCGQLSAQVLFPLFASSGNVFTAPGNGGNTVLIYMFVQQMWSSISYVVWVTLLRVVGTELWATRDAEHLVSSQLVRKESGSSQCIVLETFFSGVNRKQKPLLSTWRPRKELSSSLRNQKKKIRNLKKPLNFNLKCITY